MLITLWSERANRKQTLGVCYVLSYISFILHNDSRKFVKFSSAMDKEGQQD